MTEDRAEDERDPAESDREGDERDPAEPDRDGDEDAEEDWFERARRELAESRADEDGTDRTTEDGTNEAAEGGTNRTDEADEAEGGATEADEPGAGETHDTGGFENDATNDAAEGGVGGADPVNSSGIGLARDAGDSRSTGGGPGPDADPGPGSEADAEFGSAGSPPDAPGGGSDGEFGFAEFGDTGPGEGSAVPPGGTDFDDADLDSDIERMDLGIEGLDEMILGGVPRRSLITTIGAAGTGKTTFALQFLHEALTNGDRGVYITLEESREAILSTAEEKGYDFREYESDGLLSVVSIDPIEMANSLASIGNELGRLIREFGAERLVLDSVSLLEMMYDHPAKRRSEIFDFTRSLKEAGVTTMLISEASESNPYASRHGIVEYLTDAVFILQYVRPSDFRETRLAIEIQKIRNANHSRETKPYEITSEGISVYQQANIF
ncbi:KaiC domain-containing protein [haloarchaeon 3A1-DGR]|nr:KaiC domain-containing protein [haloarchaeon 3A1-DGR]